MNKEVQNCLKSKTRVVKCKPQTKNLFSFIFDNLVATSTTNKNDQEN
jgi:hypothetical protein